LCYYNDDYQRSNRSSNSCCNRQSLARMGWWCYCRWVCPNITRTFFFSFFFFFFCLLPLTSSSSLVSLTVTDRPSICLEHYSSAQSTRFATRKTKKLCKENPLVSNFPSQLAANYWCKSMNPPCPPCPPLFLHSTIKSIRCSRRIKCTTNLCFDSTST
jgi:hypothetical protein